jgi:glycosyltransferase involved in cell wall biosynthesis
MNKKFLCIIPCYNEEYNLPALFDDIKKNQLELHADIVFVDDGSSDETKRFIHNAGYVCLQHDANRGYGQAVITGFHYARQSGYEVFAIFPGDHQRQVTDLLILYQQLCARNVDVVVGSKFHIYSEKYGPVRRRIGNRIFSRLAKVFWQAPIEDVLSGFKVYRMSAVEPFLHKLPTQYSFDIVFSLYACRAGLKIIEVPVNCRYDEHTSKMRSVIWVSIKMLNSLLYHYVFFAFDQKNKKIIRGVYENE